MSLDDERKEIEGIYAASPIAGVAFGYAGHAFELQDATVGPSIQLTIQSGDSFQAGLGSPGTNLTRTAGIAFFKIWTEGGNGIAEGNGHAETIMCLYRNKHPNNIKFGIPHLVPIENEEPHTIHLVSVPYRRDDFNA